MNLQNDSDKSLTLPVDINWRSSSVAFSERLCLAENENISYCDREMLVSSRPVVRQTIFRQVVSQEALHNGCVVANIFNNFDMCFLETSAQFGKHFWWMKLRDSSSGLLPSNLRFWLSGSSIMSGGSSLTVGLGGIASFCGSKSLSLPVSGGVGASHPVKCQWSAYLQLGADKTPGVVKAPPAPRHGFVFKFLLAVSMLGLANGV